MKNFFKEFTLRGLMCAAGGPLVLAVVYGILDATGAAESLSPMEVALAILSITVLAFVVAGITAIYKVEQLPIAAMVLIHSGVLYASYLMVYVLNSWIPRNWHGIGVFSIVFGIIYAIVWVIVWICIKASADRLNKRLNN